MDALGVAKSPQGDENTEPARLKPNSQFASGAENVDRIREIIFGGQMREYEARFVRLEERILRESAELRTETKRRLDSLEAFMRQELDSLADRLAAERNERTGAVERLTREFGESTSALEKKLFQSDDQFARNLRELRQLMSDRQKDLLEEFSRKTTDASSLAERRIEEVRTSSVPRSSLAGLLTEIALRIEGQFSLPHPEGPGNGGADG